MSSQTHHTSTKTAAEAKITRDEAIEVERAFRQAAQAAQWNYHRAATLTPQAEHTERYRVLHAHAIEQWKQALHNSREAHKEWRRAQAAESARGNRSSYLAARKRRAA